MKKTIIILIYFFTVGISIFSVENKQYELKIDEIDLKQLNTKQKIKTLGLVKSLENDDIVFSHISDDSQNYYYCVINPNHTIKTEFKLDDYRFCIDGINLRVMNDDGRIVTFDPYTAKIVAVTKPKQMFYPMQDDNDKKKRKYIFRFYKDNAITVHRYRKDNSFDYALKKIPISDDYKILSATNGTKENEILLLIEKNNMMEVVAYDWKKNNVICSLFTFSDRPDFKNRYITSSPDNVWIFIYSENGSCRNFMFYDSKADTLYFSEQNNDKKLYFLDWSCRSNYVLLASKNDKTLYKIFTPDTLEKP